MCVNTYTHTIRGKDRAQSIRTEAACVATDAAPVKELQRLTNGEIIAKTEFTSPRDESVFKIHLQKPPSGDTRRHLEEEKGRKKEKE